MRLRSSVLVVRPRLPSRTSRVRRSRPRGRVRQLAGRLAGKLLRQRILVFCHLRSRRLAPRRRLRLLWLGRRAEVTPRLRRCQQRMVRHPGRRRLGGLRPLRLPTGRLLTLRLRRPRAALLTGHRCRRLSHRRLDPRVANRRRLLMRRRLRTALSRGRLPMPLPQTLVRDLHRRPDPVRRQRCRGPRRAQPLLPLRSPRLLLQRRQATQSRQVSTTCCAKSMRAKQTPTSLPFGRISNARRGWRSPMFSPRTSIARATPSRVARRWRKRAMALASPNRSITGCAACSAADWV